MARLNHFWIENFRGITNLKIELSGRTETPVVTLVGLNESGKTTILEAISHFVTGDPVVAKMFDEGGAANKALSLVPISKKANFTGSVVIGAEIELDESDISAFSKIAMKNFKLEIDEAPFRQPITFIKKYIFKDGNLEGGAARNVTSFELRVKKARGKLFKKYERPDDGMDLFNMIWRATLIRLPSVSYFPTFLVELPARIYLSEHDGESDINRHYRSVLQDVLDSLDENLDLEIHVAERIKAFRESEDSPNWFASFWGTPAKGQVSSVIQKISHAVSREIIGSWTKVFHRETSAKSIQLEWNIDTDKQNLPYVTFQISDGEAQYALHERSLGFRWFFSFLLFTRFKQAKNRETVFLFDEPAANLHARAQSELLGSFSRIIEGGHKLIYSTHSHHMINPTWLSGAYIVENEAIDYDKRHGVGDVQSLPTNIVATPYRVFVSQFPDRVSYYQPVMERLGWVNPSILPEAPVVITEGISDFHAFKVGLKKAGNAVSFEFVPGLGAGNSGPLISFLLGSGRKFAVLLDADKPGKREAERYRREWYLSDDVVITLDQIDSKFDGTNLESLISADTHKAICKHFSKKGAKASKKEIGAYFAEASYWAVADINLSSQTQQYIEKIAAYFNGKFKSN